MYLGGIAGTGNSQAIKALGHFFEKQQGHLSQLVAPTGSAAALIGGICSLAYIQTQR